MKDKFLDLLESQDRLIDEIQRLSDNPVDRVEALIEVLQYLLESSLIDMFDIDDNWSIENPTLEQLVRLIIKTESLYHGVKNKLSLFKDMRDR
jgi:hypothetical protein